MWVELIHNTYSLIMAKATITWFLLWFYWVMEKLAENFNVIAKKKHLITCDKDCCHLRRSSSSYNIVAMSKNYRSITASGQSEEIIAYQRVTSFKMAATRLQFALKMRHTASWGVVASRKDKSWWVVTKTDHKKFWECGPWKFSWSNLNIISVIYELPQVDLNLI